MEMKSMLFLSICLFQSTSQSDSTTATPEVCPETITRDGWNARKPAEVNYIADVWRNVIIHHTQTPKCDTFDKCRTRVKNIQAYHINEQTFPDIGYNFLVGGDGSVYEGAGWYKSGAHTKGFNNKALGVAFIGNFNSELPTTKQIQTLKDLLQCGVEIGRLDKEYELYGARQVRPTTSPGLKLYEEIQKWPHFSKNPPQNYN